MDRKLQKGISQKLQKGLYRSGFESEMGDMNKSARTEHG